ncbi:polysaccharide deacetylase family protein [Brevibacterium sp. 91QC2O2]|nr:polysaccharide deacetylase family protein [Brevibacterium sp. 91QC2O2]
MGIPSGSGPRRGLGRNTKVGAALTAVAGLLLAGCTSGGGGGIGGDSVHYGGLPQGVEKSLQSYAIVDDGESTKVPVDAHFFGLRGTSSLNEEMEKAILADLKSGGAFGTHKGFDPVTTKPGERWDEADFTSGGAAGATAIPTASALASDQAKGVTVSNRVIAAGGDYILSTVDATVKGQTGHTSFVTNVKDDKTQPASALFSDASKLGEGAALGVDDKALPTIDGQAVDKGDLSELGQQVREALGSGSFTPAKDSKTWLPDYTCGLLPCVGVTYDDGPGNAELTDEIMEALEDNDVRATFFMIGQNVANFPKEAKKLYDQGNEIENHSWSHPQLSAMSAAGVKEQIDKTNKAIVKAGIPKPTQMRPPYGAKNRMVEKASGMRLMIWDVDTLDWKTKSKQKTIDSAVNTSKPGSMFLMHSIHKWTVDGADATFKGLKKRGLYPVPSGYLFKGLPFKKDASYFCRAYRVDFSCSNPEHPQVITNR